MFKLIIVSLFAFSSTLFGASTEEDIQRLEALTKPEKKADPLNLPNHDFRATHLEAQTPLSFQGSDFRGGNFSGTPDKPKIIHNIDFSNCNLAGANFTNCIISKCTFTNANLDKALFTGSKITFSGFREALLTDANFSSTNLESVNFDAADIKRSIWRDAVIYRVSFTKTDERDIDTTGRKESHCSHEDAIKSGWFK